MDKNEKAVEQLVADYAARWASVEAVLDFARQSRKYGLPVTCSILDKPEDEQMLWAVRLLASVSGVALSEPEMPDETFAALIQKYGGALVNDARELLATARANADQL